MDDKFGSVQRRSRKQIADLANAVRRELGMEAGERIAMQPVIEFALEDMIDGAYFRVVDDHKLAGAEAKTDWHQPVITFSASTYAKLKRGDPRSRMTAAHELGHLLMHTQRPVYYYRTKSRNVEFDPEWQADEFAAALLMPERAFRSMKTVKQAMKGFGVSRCAAMRRARLLRIRIRDDKLLPSPRKKGRNIRHAP
ncbi:MAG: ImmA/IrrE family metallo-endopeptidase [Sphingopyxis sp.]|uniref:ImmA/IrrE family metallo-endopeptidase n=1 Tax=Sphingopyxis sp. TaxID=1908224 RepID=UPI0032EB179B